MKDALPKFYRDSTIVDEIIKAQSTEFISLSASFAELLAQFYVETSTYMLPEWEKIYGIASDTTLDDGQRKSRVIAMMRGVGTVTTDVLKDIVSSYENGIIEVYEHNSTYEIEVKFVSTKGIPKKLDLIESTLRVFIPAHLAFYFSFIYLTWDSLDLQTWGSLDTADEGAPLTWEQLEVWKF